MPASSPSPDLDLGSDAPRTRAVLERQSRIVSLVEAATNVAVGYFLAILTQIVVFPWFGIDVGVSTHMTIGLVFLGVSLIRSYLLRRLFEGIAARHGA
ncbi:hypothetical protein [Phaeovulum sp. NW3]|uniref:DUF7220 family protein n=1 Tax=Phaeovulum sp. NW3 TaxID=2934933 RepID=UPI0032E46D51